MGVKDLYKVLEDLCPEILIVHPLSDLVGYRVAIDISIFLYKLIRTHGPDAWLDKFILFLCVLKKHKIKAVCIFDGPNPPIEKKMEQERRRRESQKIVSKLNEARRILKIIEKKYQPENKKIDGDILREVTLLLESRKNIQNKINPRMKFDPTEPNYVIPELKTMIERYSKQTHPITDVEKEKAKKVVDLLGLAVLQASGEAETLCAYLCIRGQVDAVLSEDTDVLAYGTPLLLSRIDMKKETVTTILHSNIKKCTGFSQEEFRDLCILLSCDYNKRIKGYPPECSKHDTHRKVKNKPVGIGAKAAVCMIDVYRRLEEVEKHSVDADPLNYRRCRELFTIPKDIPYAVVPYNQPIVEDKLRTFLKSNSCLVTVKYILGMWKPTELVFEGDDSNIANESNITTRDNDSLDESDSDDDLSTLGDSVANSGLDKVLNMLSDPQSDYYKLMEKISKVGH